MAIGKLDLSECEELNSKVYTLYKHTRWGCGKIVSELGISKSQVRDVTKRGDERGGDVKDAPRFGRPTKITKTKRKRVLEVVDENLRLNLREITNTVDVGLSCSSVDKILNELSFCLKILRKKPFWRPEQKQKRKEFAQRQHQWNSQQWG